MVLYAYIRSMVKDRMRGEGRAKPARDRAHTSMARRCGAPVRTRTPAYASVRTKERNYKLLYKCNIL